VGECNAHSWSDKGKWKAVCFTPDHKNAALMWSKPAELTDYKFNGFEIGFSTTGLADAPGALASWKGSPGHNAVMINGSIWKDMNWKAIGVGLYKGYSVVWFGDNTDAAGEPAKP
ncbi:MAG: CAP domain-containing protein, partial [Bacteroidota bacterium]